VDIDRWSNTWRRRGVFEATERLCILTGGNGGASRSNGQRHSSECARVRGAARVPGNDAGAWSQT
jgi:hypothetical protein